MNILDLVAVAQGLGTDRPEVDVNEMGLSMCLTLFSLPGRSGVAEPRLRIFSELSIISAADVAKWLAGAQDLGIGDADFQRGIRFLQQLLAALTPKETTLLPNYPNPFNPETWIPYRLAREAEVAITIYDTKGTLVRRLALGNQEAGTTRSVARRRIGTDEMKMGSRLRAEFILSIPGGGLCSVARDGDCEIVVSEIQVRLLMIEKIIVPTLERIPTRRWVNLGALVTMGVTHGLIEYFPARDGQAYVGDGGRAVEDALKEGWKLSPREGRRICEASEARSLKWFCMRWTFAMVFSSYYVDGHAQRPVLHVFNRRLRYAPALQ